MVKKILGTIGTRYMIAFLNLLLLSVNGKVLGLTGMGMIGLIYASVNIAVIFNSILCGNTIVYFMNRYDVRYVFWPAYAWAFIGSAIACSIMGAFSMIPYGFALEIYGLSVLLSLVAIHIRILLGKDQIKKFNLTHIIQGGLLFFVLLCIYFLIGKKDAEAYIWGLFLTNAMAWIVSFLFIYRYIFHSSKVSIPVSTFQLIKEMFVYGLWSSADNLAEGLTTRLNYFLLQRLGGYGLVGLLDSGTKIAESVWHINRSTSSISYSQTAKTKDPEAQRQITLRFLKLTYCALILITALILLIPDWIYTDYIFTGEFEGVRTVIAGLSIGVIAFGSNSIFSHYFIGTGRIKYSVACSCIGLLVLFIAANLLVPAYGAFGSALSTSIAFVSMLVFSFASFIRLTNTTLREFLPTKEDVSRIKTLF